MEAIVQLPAYMWNAIVDTHHYGRTIFQSLLRRPTNNYRLGRNYLQIRTIIQYILNIFT